MLRFFWLEIWFYSSSIARGWELIWAFAYRFCNDIIALCQTFLPGGMPGTCGGNSKGIPCGNCPPDTYWGGSECSDCSAWSVVGWILSIVIVFAGAAVVHASTVKSKRREECREMFEEQKQFIMRLFLNWSKHVHLKRNKIMNEKSRGKAESDLLTLK